MRPRLNLTYCLVSGLLAVLLATNVSAKRLYTYTDENGVVHYTDRKPNVEAEVEERLVKVDKSNIFEMLSGGTRENPAYRFINRLHGPIEVRVTMEGSQNARSIPGLPSSFTLEAQASRELVRFEPRDRYKAFRVQVRATAVPGDPAARPDGTAYRIPLQTSRKVPISQAFNGNATHNGPQSRHAVDFVVPVGTKVVAARSGTVMSVDNDFYGSGTEEKYAARANNIRVVHTDGTMAVYAHLKLESSRVREGQTVAVGDVLGETGNTGFSTGPHLHFTVQRNRGGQVVTVPFKLSHNGREFTPEAGMVLD